MGCWAHARRKFFELARLSKAPSAIEAIERIDELFAIERDINGKPPPERKRVRNEYGRWSPRWRSGCPSRSRNDIFTYKRVYGDSLIVVALNMVHQPRKHDWEGMGRLLLSTYLDREETPIEGPTLLRPDEGLIIKVQSAR